MVHDHGEEPTEPPDPLPTATLPPDEEVAVGVGVGVGVGVMIGVGVAVGLVGMLLAPLPVPAQPAMSAKHVPIAQKRKTLFIKGDPPENVLLAITAYTRTQRPCGEPVGNIFLMLMFCMIHTIDFQGRAGPTPKPPA